MILPLEELQVRYCNELTWQVNEIPAHFSQIVILQQPSQKASSVSVILRARPPLVSSTCQIANCLD